MYAKILGCFQPNLISIHLFDYKTDCKRHFELSLVQEVDERLNIKKSDYLIKELRDGCKNISRNN